VVLKDWPTGIYSAMDGTFLVLRRSRHDYDQ
jgi:hypothetical protein